MEEDLAKTSVQQSKNLEYNVVETLLSATCNWRTNADKIYIGNNDNSHARS